MAKKIENWASKPTSDVYKDALKFYDTVAKAFKNREEEADEACKEYWNIYNAQPDSNQQYQGNSKCYVPAVRDAINARAKRALRQLFPNRYNHVTAIGTDGQVPYPQLALLEHYIRQTNLKSICRSLLISGDVTGQWGIYVDWMHEVRNISGAVKKSVYLEVIEAVDPTEEEVEESDEEVIEQGPQIYDFATEDMVVVPPTVDNIEKADLVAMKLRLSKEQIKSYVDDGVFILPEESDISDWIKGKKRQEKINPPKSRTSDAGIKTEGTNSYALVYEVTARMELEKGKKALVYIYYAGENDIVGIIRAPQWMQRRPQISAPVDRISGSFNGISKIEAVKFLQWNLNDFWNMGQDSAMYSMLPIVMTDPEKNPNYAMMVFGLAAVWPTNPNDTQFASFPQLWKDSVQMCNAIKAQIYESLDVNPMMMGQMPNGRKNANAVGAQMQESSVSIMDHAERFEEVILNTLMERFFEYDAQFRDQEVTVTVRGDVGVQAAMMKIPPQQWGERYTFQWSGTDFVMNMQRMQQQIATMNVLRGIPPQQLNGRKLDITPILENLVSTVFGSELSGRILIDERNKYTIDPSVENEIMVNGMIVDVHEADNDQAHIIEHQRAAQLTGDPSGIMRAHLDAHIQSMMKKRQMAAPQQQGAPGVPGGAGPGVAGTPRMGAQAEGPRGVAQNPPGAIHPDQIAGGMPRG